MVFIFIYSHFSFFSFFSPDNKTFYARVADSSIRKFLKVGSVVSYKYLKISKSGLPVAPVIFRVRDDMTWKEVLHNYASPRKKEFIGNKIYSHARTTRTRHSQHAWAHARAHAHARTRTHTQYTNNWLLWHKKYVVGHNFFDVFK